MLFSEIIDKQIIEKNYSVPINNELVIHLRTGDVVVHSWYLNKPYIELIQEFVDKFNINKVTFVTSFFYANVTTKSGTKLFKYHENNHNKNITKLTNLFKNVIMKFPSLNIDVLSSEGVDTDFVYLCKANHLILDRGGFSELIGIIQKSFKKNQNEKLINAPTITDWRLHNDKNMVYGKIKEYNKHFLGNIEMFSDVEIIIKNSDNIDFFTWHTPSFSNKLWANRLYGWSAKYCKSVKRDDANSWPKEKNVISGERLQ